MPCPSDVELAELIEGLQPSERREEIEAHVDGCEDCRRALAALVDTIAPTTTPDAEAGGPSSLVAGDRLGRYRITRRLGAGGMGVVFAAHDPRLDREVAIKILLPSAVTEELRLRLRSEARALARLAHPHVVSIYSVEHARGCDFVVMELVDGESLALWQQGRPPWRDIVDAYLQAGRGLAAAHARGLVHRDFKPANCIRDPRGRVRVLDFGLARDLGDVSGASTTGPTDEAALSELSPSPLTRTGAVLGTVAYMPFEQFRSARVDARSDQWSFCASLFEALAGRRPYAGAQTVAEQEWLLSSSRPRAPHLPGIPRGLWRVLERGLSREPSERWPSMDALLTALTRALDAPSRRRRHASVGALVLAASGGWWLLPSPSRAECASAPSRQQSLWSERARARARHGVLATDSPYAEDTWQRVEPRLDAYAASWAAADERACVERREHADAQASAALARSRCLEDRRRHFIALVDVLSSADPGTVERAVESIAGLPSLTPCDAPPTSASVEPTPQDPALARRVDELRVRLATAQALAHAGRIREGLEATASLRDDATPLAYPPLQCELDLLEGWLSTQDGRFEDARTQLERAFHVATREDHHRVAAEAAMRLVQVYSSGLGDHETALDWARHARARAERLQDEARVAELDVRVAGVELHRGDPQRAFALYRSSLGRLEALQGPRDASTLDALGGMAHAQLELGEYDDAAQTLERVIEAERELLGPHHPSVATSLHLLASAQHRRGEPERARDLLLEVLAIREPVLGPTHPHVSSVQGNLALLQLQLGQTQAAAELLVRVLDAQVASLGPDHEAVAETLHTLGHAELELGQVDSAERRLRRAIAISEQNLGPQHVTAAQKLETLANIELARGDLQASRDLELQALDIARAALGEGHPELGAYLSNLGTAHARLGEHAASIQRFSEALVLWEPNLGADHPNLAFALTGLGSARLELGDVDGAVEPLARALALRERHTTAPGGVALTRFALARALAKTDLDAACEHARLAIEEYGRAEGGRQEQIEEIQRWSARCPSESPG